MLDTTQILLLFLIIIIGGTLVLVGVQMYLILRELRKAVTRVNGVLDEFHQTSVNVTSTTQHIKETFGEFHVLASNITEGVTAPAVTGVAAFGLVKSILKPFLDDRAEEEDDE